MQRNNIRFDISNYLIHFFRDVDLESNNYILLPEHCGFNSIHHQTKIDALYLLRCALRNKKISASWSYRNRKRTIYGVRPAICFTDMPLAAFVQTSQERIQRGENIGQYALMLKKKDMFNHGARPVIYALDGSPEKFFSSGSSNEERIINTDLLALNEQYRYVTYNPSGVDWTHEREWRWPYKGNLNKFNDEIERLGGISDIKDSPGLELSNMPFSEAGIIVKNSEDVEAIVYDILALVDRGDLSRDSFKFIIPLDKLNSPQDIIDPQDVSKLFNENIINLSSFLHVEEEKSQEINMDITNIIDFTLSDFESDDSSNEFGKCWVWLLDNKSEVTRSLINSGKVEVNHEGRYLLDLGISVSAYSLSDQEKISQLISKELIQRYRIEAGYFSVIGSNDPNSVPFYTDFLKIDQDFYNTTIEVDW